MKKLFTILALCITVLTTGMASFADPPLTEAMAPKVLKVEVHVVSGMIVGQDLDVIMMMIVSVTNAVCAKSVALNA